MEGRSWRRLDWKGGYEPPELPQVVRFSQRIEVGPPVLDPVYVQSDHDAGENAGVALDEAVTKDIVTHCILHSQPQLSPRDITNTSENGDVLRRTKDSVLRMLRSSPQGGEIQSEIRQQPYRRSFAKKLGPRRNVGWIAGGKARDAFRFVGSCDMST